MTCHTAWRLSVPFLTAAALCVSLNRAGACTGVSPSAHRIVVGKVIELLPDPVGSFFAAHAVPLRDLVADIPERAAARHTMRGDTHFILLDVAARDASVAERRRAALAFPRDAGEASKLCRQYGVTECGRLPWGLIETYAGLVVAFRANDEPGILANAAAMVHLSTDAAMPFNTTTDRDGSASGATVPHAEADKAPNDNLRSAAWRFQHALIDRNRKRLAFEVRVWPQRLARVPGPLTPIFETLLSAQQEIGELTALHRATGVHTGRTVSDISRSADDAVSERALSVIEPRLEAGALLGAELIDAAWVTAGRPALARDVARSTTSDSETAANGAASPCGKPFCGSRDSTVFHRATCPHVQRIKPENLVGFSTPGDARRAGRKGCRQCKPESRDHPNP